MKHAAVGCLIGLGGTIEARGEVLRAALDGTPCLAYGPVPSTSASARSQSSSACPSVRPRATYRA